MKNKGDKEYLLGYLAYVKDININQYNQLKKIYKRYDKQNKIFL